MANKLPMMIGVSAPKPKPAAIIKAKKTPEAAKLAGFNKVPKGDNRAGRLNSVATDRGTFRFKANKKGE